MSPERELSVSSHSALHFLTGKPFNPQAHIVRSTTRVIGALVFGHHFLSEEPFFLEIIQAINLGLAFASTTWRRVICFWGGWCAGMGMSGFGLGRSLSQGLAAMVKCGQEVWLGLILVFVGSYFCLYSFCLSTQKPALSF